MATHVAARTVAILLGALATMPPPSVAGQGARDSRPGVAALVRRGRSFLGSIERLDAVRSVDAVAACEGPSGRFTTSVQSHLDGDLVFHQRYTYRATAYLAGIHGGHAWQRDTSSGITDAGDDVLAVLRSHEFVMILLNPESRLSNPRSLGVGRFAGERVSTVAFVDETGNRVEIHYAQEDGRPVGLTFQNPLPRGAPRIDVEYTAWSRVGDLRLPRRLTIVHGKEMWRYQFTRIEIDTLSAEAFDPRAASSRSESDRG